jgi:hypothetical protein
VASEERAYGRQVGKYRSRTEMMMTADLILRLATFSFLVLVFVYAFAINL